TFRPCLLQRTSAGLRSVHPGDNITLHCDIAAEYEVAWYHQSSEEMKLLVSVGRANRGKQYFINHIVDEDHYEVAGNASLVIVGVYETDLGLYYCGGRNHTSFLRFGRAIRLNFAEGEGDEGREEGSEDTTQSPVTGSLDSESHQILTVALMSVGLVSVLMNIVFSWVICYMVQACELYTDPIRPPHVLPEHQTLGCDFWPERQRKTNLLLEKHQQPPSSSAGIITLNHY
ncbi:hypothetical protein NFI96_015845, partial [Prochilodus magdalenae]